MSNFAMQQNAIKIINSKIKIIMDTIKFSNFENSKLRDFISQNWDAKDFPYISPIPDDDLEDTKNIVEYTLMPGEEIPKILEHFYLDQVNYVPLHPYGDTFIKVYHFSEILESSKPLKSSYFRDYLEELKYALESCQVQLFQSDGEFTLIIYVSLYDTAIQL